MNTAISTVVASTVNIEGTMANVGKLREQVNKLRGQIETGYDAVKDSLDLLPTNVTFWKLIKKLNEDIKYVKSYEIGTGRFIHNLSFGHINVIKSDVLYAMRFVKTYGELRDALYQPLNDVITGFGDDGYGDLVDSFPLFGKKRYELALKGQLVGDMDAQYQGENYMNTTMNNKARECFASHCRHEFGSNDYEGEPVY